MLLSFKHPQTEIDKTSDLFTLFGTLWAGEEIADPEIRPPPEVYNDD